MNPQIPQPAPGSSVLALQSGVKEHRPRPVPTAQGSGVGKGTQLGVATATAGMLAVVAIPSLEGAGEVPRSQPLGPQEECSLSQTLRNESLIQIWQGAGWAGCVPGRRDSSEASQRDPAAGRGLILPERQTQHAQGGGRRGLWPMGTEVSKVNGDH